MCAVSDEKDGVEYCRQFFPGKEPIRLPADPSGTQKYGALTRGGMFHTRGGKLPLSPAVVKQFDEDAGGGHAAYSTTVYLATVANGEVTGVQPTAEIDENAILRFFFAGRSMEGLIDSLVAPNRYSHAKRFPVRIDFAKDPVDGTLKGTFVNTKAGVRGANGKCIPALPKTGNPFAGIYTADIQIKRYPAMHTLFDDELLIAWNANINNMGSGYYPSVATLLGGDTLDKAWTTWIHGTPWVGPSVDVHLVTGGGGSC